MASTATIHPFTQDQVNIYVTSYDRGIDNKTGLKKPEHWAVVFASDPNTKGKVYQLILGRPRFRYRISPARIIRKAKTLIHCLKIGRLMVKDIGNAEELFNKLDIFQDKEEWNCQSWVTSAVQALEDLKYVESGTTGELRVNIEAAEK